MRAVILAMLPVMLYSADFQIDHVTVCAADVKKLQAGLAAVGIPTVYGGAHHNQTTEMALMSMPDGSYLELMGLQSGAPANLVNAHVWSRFLKSDAGPCAWALHENDLNKEVTRLRQTGTRVSPPVPSGRKRPDGVQLDWETSDIGDGIRGAFFPFLIRDLTDRNLRVYPQGKPVTEDFLGVSRVVLAVRDLNAAVARYQRSFGLREPSLTTDAGFGARVAWFAGTPVVLAQPLDARSWLANHIERFGESPCAFILGIANAGSQWQATTHSDWFGSDVSWFDPEKVGWRLGFEKAK